MAFGDGLEGPADLAQVKANLDLASAAPDLLDVAKGFKALYARSRGVGYSEKEVHNLLEKALLAIAKAEGRAL